MRNHKDADTIRAMIKVAFAALRFDGYFARMNWQCCQSCGWAAVPTGKADKAVFLHRQDSDNIDEDGSCHLAWSGDPDLIVRRLGEAGLEVEWDGSRHTRPEVRLPTPPQVVDHDADYRACIEALTANGMVLA